MIILSKLLLFISELRLLLILDTWVDFFSKKLNYSQYEQSLPGKDFHHRMTLNRDANSFYIIWIYVYCCVEKTKTFLCFFLPTPVPMLHYMLCAMQSFLVTYQGKSTFIKFNNEHITTHSNNCNKILWEQRTSCSWAYLHLCNINNTNTVFNLNVDRWCSRVRGAENMESLGGDPYHYLWGGWCWVWQGHQHDSVRSSAPCQSACCSSSLTLSKSSVELLMPLNPACAKTEALPDCYTAGRSRRHYWWS